MTIIVAEVYEAFESAGADKDKALAAASAVADYQRDISDPRGDVKLVKWIVGLNLGISVTVLMLIGRLLAATAT